MIDVKRDPLRFRLRLVGTEIVRFTGRDATGRWLDEIYPGYAASDAFAFHSAVAREGKPGYRKGGMLSNHSRSDIEAERLYLPLSQSGRHVYTLLVVTLYDRRPPPARRRP